MSKCLTRLRKLESRDIRPSTTRNRSILDITRKGSFEHGVIQCVEQFVASLLSQSRSRADSDGSIRRFKSYKIDLTSICGALENPLPQWEVGWMILMLNPSIHPSIHHHHVCMYVSYMYVCMYVYMTYVCMNGCMYVCMYVCMYPVCMYVCIYDICMYVWMCGCMCMYVCMYVWMMWGIEPHLKSCCFSSDRESRAIYHMALSYLLLREGLQKQ